MMPINPYLLLLLFFCLACQNTSKEKTDHPDSNVPTTLEFDHEKWKTKVGRDYPYRALMLDDLISNDKLKGLKRKGILDALGEPNRIDNNYLFYTIAQKRIVLFPLHTRTLVIKLSQDSTINWIRIHE